jgi:hypothetical protein
LEREYVKKVLSKVGDKARKKETEKRYKEGRHEKRQKETGKGKRRNGLGCECRKTRR